MVAFDFWFIIDTFVIRSFLYRIYEEVTVADSRKIKKLVNRWYIR
jgi:hypothetical protein